jgi:hypothetical protein
MTESAAPGVGARAVWGLGERVDLEYVPRADESERARLLEQCETHRAQASGCCLGQKGGLIRTLTTRCL